MARQVGKSRGLATSKDVAARAGVSQSTVSYVMSGKRAVSPEVRRRVEKAMSELDYQPNAGARALRGARTNVIALVVHLDEDADPSETMPYIDTIVEEARARDHEVVLATGDEGAEGLLRLARRRVADAFVIMDVRTDDARLETAAGLGRPVVLFGRPRNAYGLDAVDFDSRRAAEMLVEELVVSGHRRILVIGETSEKDAEELRFISEFHEGAREAARRAEVAFESVHGERDGWRALEGAVAPVLASGEARIGVIARTPRMTEWLVHLARAHHVRWGEDVSLVSMTTDRNATRLDPTITNVSPLPRDLSRLAMRILFERIDGDEGPARLALVTPRHVRRRESTAVFD